MKSCFDEFVRKPNPEVCYEIRKYTWCSDCGKLQCIDTEIYVCSKCRREKFTKLVEQGGN